jgi:uncharacterized protein YecE (DUF72 family)
MAIEGYFLGCGVWNNPDWGGSLFSTHTRPSGFLREYASVFNAVEGNSTFYGIPSLNSLDRWKSETPSGFRFCFKFPRLISHERRLSDTHAHTRAFLDLLDDLGDRVGPVFLQLPPSFGPSELPLLDRFLRLLPDRFSYAVEVRDPSFFGPDGNALNLLLSAHGVDRVILDNRALVRAAHPGGASLAADRSISPAPPAFLSPGSHPFIRFVGTTDAATNLSLLSEWAKVVSDWVTDGKTPHVFIHTSDDRSAPHLARIFHELMSNHTDVGRMPDWPGEVGVRQLTLF